MVGLDIPLPDFWIVYLLMFWVLVGMTTTPVIFRHRGLSPLVGTLLGVGVGVLCGVVFMLLMAILKPVIDALDRPFLGALLALVVSAVIVLVLLGFAKRFVPMAQGQDPVAAEGGPRATVNFSTRVDKIDPNWRSMQSIRASVAAMLAVLTLIPVFWMGMTAFKSYPDAVASPPKVAFDPTMEGIVTLLTRRRQMTEEQKAEYEKTEDLNWADKIMLKSGQAILGQSDYVKRLKNSLIIAVTSTVLSVGLGLLSAYAFSRFRVPGKGDLLFFILSTRMLPPVVVTIPIFLMYRELGLVRYLPGDDHSLYRL